LTTSASRSREERETHYYEEWIRLSLLLYVYVDQDDVENT